jgi:spermidine synthase
MQWQQQTRGAARLTLLYAVTIFLSAFLLFEVQPIIGKVILPWFGGAAAVWTACLLFFQAVLLLGYGYAHLTTRYLAPRAQAVLHLVLLAGSLASLPILPSAAWKPEPGADPLWRITLLLAASIGPTYGMLSTTGPLLQAWFARERPGAVPYRLFALSNLGSMLALLGYPFGVEPLLPVRTQSTAFTAGYVAFALACGTLAWRAGRHRPAPQRQSGQPPAPPIRLGRALQWGLWAALASALLLALTSDLTQNVAPIPLLWVLPLAIYLLSFILCFEGRAWYRRGLFLVAALVGLVGLAIGLTPRAEHLYVPLSIALHGGALFAICMVCHGELARAKPDPRHLTTFYLMVAAGGVTGGLFTAVLAPHAFNGDWEYPIVLAAVAAMVAIAFARDPVAALWPLPPTRGFRLAQVLVTAGAALAVLGCAGYAVYRVLDDAKLLARNFYGTLRIEERAGATPEGRTRLLFHGTIIHGFQFLQGEWRHEPTSYYTEESGVGVGIAATRPALAANGTAPSQRVGVIGLGAGTLAAYARPGDRFSFYEINVLVEHLARTEFTYLSDAGPGVDVRLGDARLVLEREPPQGYDLFVVDAFSGDAVPIHLLTLEAFQLYFRHLKPDGILAVHASNKRLDLAPIVTLAADRFGKHAWLIDTDDDEDAAAYGSTWVLVASRADRLAQVEVPEDTRKLTRPANLLPWTDDYSSLYHVLR